MFKKINLQINRLDLIIAVYIACVAIAELMGGKTFPLFHIGKFTWNASVAIFVIPIIFSINDAIVEVFGVARAKSVYRSSLITIVIFMLFSLLAINLPPSARFKDSEAAYDLIFGQSARIAFASLTAFAIADFLDIIIFQKIKEKIGKKALWFRSNFSNIISQFIDTVIFMFLAFYAFNKGFGDNFSFLFSLIIPYWLLKCFMSIIETPFVYLAVKWLKGEAKK
ncbi:putative queuosine precursor transporter [Candidatus Roizmanbacteria bacterium]|nr:putative queuosine precursor transporter [Candidatus Roizmanbacteria bacterium]